MTGDSAFSMFNLSLKEDWINNKKFCHRLSDDEGETEEKRVSSVTTEAQVKSRSKHSGVLHRKF